MDPEELLYLAPLSYFFGAWLGDGWFHANPMTRQYNCGISTSDKEIVTRCYLRVSKFFTDLPKASFQEQNDPRANVTMYSCRWFGKDFADLLYILTNDKQKLPEYIWKVSQEYQLEMLAGLMDTDGSIMRQKNAGTRTGYAYYMNFGGTRGFVREVPALFNAVGIKVGKITVDAGRKVGYLPFTRFYIPLQSAVEHGFYFRCNRKMQRLQDYVHKFTDLKVYNAPDDGMD